MSHPSSQAEYSVAGILAGVWGVAGMILVLADVATRLSKYMLEAMMYDWSILHWALFILNTSFMAYAEGYRGFQKSFVPRTVSRAFYLADNPGWVNGICAPLYCVGYFGAGKRTAKVVWIGTVLIVVAVVLIRQVPQPWRGIIDAGVVVGLSWGIVASCLISVRALLARRAPLPLTAAAK